MSLAFIFVLFFFVVGLWNLIQGCIVQVLSVLAMQVNGDYASYR